MDKLRDCLRTLKTETRDEFLNNIRPYWLSHSVDEINGGFFGVVNNRNEPDQKADKSAILNARIMWTFSLTYQWLGDTESRQMAERAYNYFTTRFLDKKYGGIYWMLDHKGEVKDPKKHVYVQAFAIYGLVEYYAAFKDPEALDKAKELYHLIENKCSDKEFGGYFEAYSREWDPSDDVRLSSKDKNAPKSMNTHLHVLEAYTNLYRYEPRPELKERLEALIDIFLNHIINKKEASLNCFLDVNWESVAELRSYGHDIETTWLLLEAAEVIEDSDRIRRVEQIIPSVIEQIIKHGLDEDGGLINERKGTHIIDHNKDWWPQAEAMVGFLNVYSVTEDPKYLRAACDSWEFIKTYIIDHKYGEWFEKVNRDGIPYNELDKIRAWKAPYHNTRAIYEVNRRVDEILEMMVGQSEFAADYDAKQMIRNK
ncbi:MAG TPA: N-acyl-D-glucosamine 2-epimerase [Balneolaceae bacterium]|nr:N-acyl-D-glucosamine 2-epimerase [Balneolaceae bacterium]|tara:strand:+ start:26409 stop:27686 length:1278 start_codon:yes stop_codon:yes gene_type:complete